MTKPPFPDYIDSSARKTAVGCMKQAEYESIRHLKPKGVRIHLHFGTCLARGLEIFRTAFYSDEIHLSKEMKKKMDFFSYKYKEYKSDCDKCMVLAMNAIILEWKDVEAPSFGSGENKSIEACVCALISFFDEYPPESDPVQPVMTKDGPAVEWSFALPIPNVWHPTTGAPMLYVGRFDMLAEMGGAIMVNDEKTAGQLGAGFAKNWKLASQLTGYTWAAKEFGYNVQGVVIRGIGILTKKITHQFIIEKRPQWMIDRWLEQLQRDTRRLIAAWEEGYFDYTLDGACSYYGGCPYLPLCTSKNPEPWIEADYEVEVWDPLVKEK